MTKQEIYNISKTGLLAQNCKARDSQGCCALRVELEDGTVHKCAVGQCIPDPVYKKIMDSVIVDNLHLHFPELIPYIVPSDVAECDQRLFVEDLRLIHDRHNPAEWKDEYRRFAYKWTLIP